MKIERKEIQAAYLFVAILGQPPSTWLLFCAIVIGFMGAGEMIGVTSLCRFWLFDEDGYNRLLHFF